MQRIIRLADLHDLPTPPHGTYSAAQMDAARTHMATRGLRFDNATGVTYDNDGCQARYSNPADHQPYTDPADVLRWQFLPFIANSASRVARGFTP